MSKEIKIKITLYNPKELWKMFCNRVFWPRKKQCAEYCDLGEEWMKDAVISNIIARVDYLDSKQEEQMEIAVKSAIEDVFKRLAKVMSEPF